MKLSTPLSVVSVRPKKTSALRVESRITGEMFWRPGLPDSLFPDSLDSPLPSEGKTKSEGAPEEVWEVWIGFSGDESHFESAKK